MPSDSSEQIINTLIEKLREKNAGLALVPLAVTTAVVSSEPTRMKKLFDEVEQKKKAYSQFILDLSAVGIKSESIAKSENSQFIAIAKQLKFLGAKGYTEYDDEVLAADLRTKAMEELTKRPEPVNLAQNDFGNNDTLDALAKVLNKDIVVLSPINDLRKPMIFRPLGKLENLDPDQTIILLFNGLSHYETIRNKLDPDLYRIWNHILREQAYLDYKNVINSIYGLKEISIKEDGNCQFRAVANQLKQLNPMYKDKSEEDIIRDLRKNVINELKRKRNFFEAFSPTSGGSDPSQDINIGIDSFIWRLEANPSEYGDDRTLLAMANILGQDIIVLHPNGQHGQDLYRPDGRKTKLDPSKTIILLFNNILHYETVTTRPNDTFWATWNEIVEKENAETSSYVASSTADNSSSSRLSERARSASTMPAPVNPAAAHVFHAVLSAGGSPLAPTEDLSTPADHAAAAARRRLYRDRRHFAP
jgi:hypothetical protein